MNKLILVGNLTKDPELRYTPNQIPVCNFDVAVNERRGGQDSTTYFRVTAWQKQAENCAKYLSKGKKVFVSGPVSASAYESSDGSARAALNVTANEVEFLSPGSAGGDAQPAARQAEPQGYTPVSSDDLPF